MTARRIGFIGIRLEDSGTYHATVALYRDTLRLDVTVADGDRSTRFQLADGTPLHVYGPDDVDHEAFGERACIGLVVDDVDATRTELEASGIEILDDPTQRDGTDAWFHYRAPDGTVHELIGPDRRA